MIRVRSHLNRWLTSLVLFSLVLGPLSVPAQVSASQRTPAPTEEPALDLSDLAITAVDDDLSGNRVNAAETAYAVAPEGKIQDGQQLNAPTARVLSNLVDFYDGDCNAGDMHSIACYGGYVGMDVARPVSALRPFTMV